MKVKSNPNEGGGKQLLSLQSEENTDTEVVPTNLIDNEWGLKEMQ